MDAEDQRSQDDRNIQAAEKQAESVSAAAERVVLGEVGIRQILQDFQEAVRKKVYELLISCSAAEDVEREDPEYTRDLLKEINPQVVFMGLTMQDAAAEELEGKTINLKNGEERQSIEGALAGIILNARFAIRDNQDRFAPRRRKALSLEVIIKRKELELSSSTLLNANLSPEELKALSMSKGIVPDPDMPFDNMAESRIRRASLIERKGTQLPTIGSLHEIERIALKMANDLLKRKGNK